MNLTKKQKKLVVDMGARWKRMSVSDILDESAVIFLVAVAIAGHKEAEADGAPEV